MLLVLLLLLAASPSHAHQAPTGWSYPMACCHDRDCREIPDAIVTESDEGWTVKGYGFVKRGDEKQSGDEHFHVCRLADSPPILCFFVPARGM